MAITKPTPRFLKDLGVRKKNRVWLVECPVCKKEYTAFAFTIKNGTSTKCRSCANRLSSKKHGYTNHPLYKVWSSMIQRCHNKGCSGYRYYGERGVTVCAEWRESPETFIEWALANGWEKGMEIDKDILSERHGIHPPIYSPETCLVVSREANCAAMTGSGVRMTAEGKFNARIVGEHIGNYETMEAAASAYREAKNNLIKRRLHGHF